MRATRRGLIAGAAALAAYSALPRDAALAMRDFVKPFDPFQLGTVAYWLRAEDYWLMTDDGAGLISSVKDRAGALALTAATTARPTWGVASFNASLPGLTFDGSANCLAGTSFGNIPTGASACAIIAVGSFTTPTLAATGTVMSYGGTSGATARTLGVAQTSGVPFVNDGATQLNGTVAVSNPAIMYADWSGTTENGYLNAVLMNSATTIASLNTGTTRIRIGALNTTSAARFMPMVLSQLLILNAVPSASDRAKLEGYFAWKGKFQSQLPASHAYKLGPPAA